MPTELIPRAEQTNTPIRHCICQGNPDHDDPVVVGLGSTPGIHYALCRRCGAYTQIRPSPQLAEDDLRAGRVRGVLDVQHELPPPAGGENEVAALAKPEVA